MGVFVAAFVRSLVRHFATEIHPFLARSTFPRVPALVEKNDHQPFRDRVCYRSSMASLVTGASGMFLALVVDKLD